MNIPTDGPDAALFRLARKLKCRYSQAFVVQSIAAHPRSGSLRALVDVATTMGIQTAAVKAEIEALPDIRLPAVAHFSDGASGDGFGVLEAVEPDRVRLWDSSQGSRWVSSTDFASSWTGVVVQAQRSEKPGVRESGRSKQRFLEIVGGDDRTPSLAEGRSARALRLALACLALPLLVATVTALPSAERFYGGVVIVVTMVGVVITTMMAAATGDGDSASLICRRGRFVDCQSVLTSRFSRAFGFPLSDIGLSFYGAVLLLLMSAGWLEPTGTMRIVTLAFTATVPFALMLIAVQVTMRQFCTLCLGSHLVNVTGAALGWTVLWEGPFVRRDMLLAVLAAGFFVVMLLVAIPFVRRSRSLAQLTDRHRRLVGSPFATLADVLSQRAIDDDPSAAAIPLDGEAHDHRLVLFVHPGCGKCLPVLREVFSLREVPIDFFIGVAPKPGDERDREVCSVLVAAWLAVEAEKAVDAYVAAKNAVATSSGLDAIPAMARSIGVETDDIARHLPQARSIAERAEAIVDRYADGTPALFFDGKPFVGRAEHLAYLALEHPELLRAR